MSERPKTELLAFGRQYLFDEANNRINAVTPTGSSPTWVSFTDRLSLGQRQRWLGEWALWIDRAREPAISAARTIDARACLGALLDCPRAKEPRRGAWIDVSRLPEFPRHAAWLQHSLARSSLARTALSPHLSAYRLALRRWAGDERVRWSTRRADTIAELAAERRYEAACERLRSMLGNPSDAEELLSAIQSILAQVTERFVVGRLSLPEKGKLSLIVDFADAGASLAVARHEPDRNGWHLVSQDGKIVADRRLRELSVLGTLAIADFMQELNRAATTVTMIVRQKIKPGLVREIHIETLPERLLASRARLVDAIATRRIPEVSGLRFIDEGTTRDD